MPLIQGSTTPTASAVATAASAACPPSFSTRAPISDATRFCDTTMPPLERTDGLLTWRWRDRFGDSASAMMGILYLDGARDQAGRGAGAVRWHATKPPSTRAGAGASMRQR